MLRKFNQLKTSFWARLLLSGILFYELFPLNLAANPTGLIDNFALGISRSETPEQLKAERNEAQEEPFFILQQSGNIIFQVLANGNIEWSGTLNRKSNTTMGNLMPVADGIQLGSTESSWGKLYLNEMYFPLLEKEAKLLSSDKVDVTLNQLEAVHSAQNDNEIQLRLKSNQTVAVKNPIHRSFYNVSHIIPILIKRLQDDRHQLDLQASQISNLDQKLNGQTKLIEELQKHNHTQDPELQKVQQLIAKQQKNDLQSHKKVNELENEIKKLKDQLKLLTSSIEDKLKPEKTTTEEEKASP